MATIALHYLIVPNNGLRLNTDYPNKLFGQ